MEQVKVIPVEHPGQMKAFVELPWKIYAQDPQWVPPLKKEVARLLDPQVLGTVQARCAHRLRRG